MRVAHISDCYLPRTGGIELQVRGLSQAQLAAGESPRSSRPRLPLAGKPKSPAKQTKASRSIDSRLTSRPVFPSARTWARDCAIYCLTLQMLSTSTAAWSQSLRGPLYALQSKRACLLWFRCTRLGGLVAGVRRR